MAFEILTGALPFRGDDPMLMLSQNLREPAPRVEEIRPDLPSQLGDLVETLLSKDPDRRRLLKAEYLVQTLRGVPL